MAGVDRGRKIGHLAEPADPDPEPMEAVHRRPTAGLPVRRSDLLVPEPLAVGEDSVEVRTRECAGPQLEYPGYMVEEPRLAFGAKERPQEFPTGPCILLEPGAVLSEPLVFLLRARVVGHPFEKLDRHIPIPYLTDEPREAPDP